MTDPLEKYRVMVRSIKFSPSSLDKNQPTTQVELNSASKPSPSTSLSWAKISSVLDSGPPVDPSEHIADLVRNAVSKHTVLPNSYAIPANIGDRISQMSPTREVRPTIIQPPLPEPDPNWKPSISVISPVSDVIISEKIEVISPVSDVIISEKIEVISPVSEEKQEEVIFPVIKEIISEKTEEITEVSQEVISEKTQEVISEKTEEITEVSQEIISEKTEEITEVSQEIISEKTEEITEVSQEIISEKTEEITEVSQEVISEKTEEITEVSQEVISEKTEEITEVSQEIISEKTQEVISEKTEEITEVPEKETERVIETSEKHSPILEIICPKCGSNNSRKNGFYKDKQRYACKDCGKQFVNESQEIITEIKPAKTATKESKTKGGFSGKSNNRTSKNKKKGKR